MKLRYILSYKTFSPSLISAWKINSRETKLLRDIAIEHGGCLFTINKVFYLQIWSKTSKWFFKDEIWHLDYFEDVLFYDDIHFFCFGLEILFWGEFRQINLKKFCLRGNLIPRLI